MTNINIFSIGRYHLIEPLGEGGMAVVYKAYDTHLECEVAVKVIRIDNLPRNAEERALKRFEREAKAVARLNHPNIVKVTDYGEEDGKPYLVMPYLPGGTLKEMIKERGQIPWQEAARILIPIAEALAYAHSQGVIHRDIKPSNILLTQSGQPMLTDFGVAKVIEEDATQDITGTSATVGTPEYMAPEQITSKTVDARADLYSLGVVFYEMVTGRKPFEADTPLAVMIMHSRDPLPRPSQFMKDLPTTVEQFLFKALTKKPEDRYQSAEEMVRVLKTMISGLISESKKMKGSGESTKDHPKTTLKTISLMRIGLITLCVVLFIALYTFVSSRTDKPAIPDPTETFTKNITLQPVIISTITLTITPKPTSISTTTPEVIFTSTPTKVIVEGQLFSQTRCRKGPDENLYGYDYVLNPQKVQILGRNNQDTWIYFQQNENNTPCWTTKQMISYSYGLSSSLEIVPTPEVTGDIYFGYSYSKCPYEKGWNSLKCSVTPICYKKYTLAQTKEEANFFYSELTQTSIYPEYRLISLFNFSSDSHEPNSFESITCPVYFDGVNFVLEQ